MWGIFQRWTNLFGKFCFLNNAVCRCDYSPYSNWVEFVLDLWFIYCISTNLVEFLYENRREAYASKVRVLVVLKSRVANVASLIFVHSFLFRCFKMPEKVLRNPGNRIACLIRGWISHWIASRTIKVMHKYVVMDILTRMN